MAATIKLRPWQQEALERFEAHDGADFLAVATPGAGKTSFALTAACRALAACRAVRSVAVVPTQHLKYQWATAGERFGLHLDPDWSAGYGALPSDVHGVVVTYQQVAANPESLRRLVQGAFVVLDEIHHAADARSWGDGVRIAFEHAKTRLCLSGTPFRSDQSRIPFIRYVGEEAVADYEYGYGDALQDRGVVRQVYFPRTNGRMEWTAPDGSVIGASFDDKLTRTLSSQRLRTALDLSGEWLPTVLRRAHRQLQHIRRTDPRAGGMVISMDQDHARGIARTLTSVTGETAVVVTSDDPDASNKISSYGESSVPWIVAVRMVSEGVDIPRLRVGVYATNTATDLFFRQAVGRLVRFSGNTRQQNAYMFIPDDWRLRGFAMGIAEQRRHSLRKPDRPDEGEPESDELQDPLEEELREEQLSLFAPISAVPLDEEGRPIADDTDGEVFDGEEDGGEPGESEELIPGMAADDSECAVAATGDGVFSLTAPDLPPPVVALEPLPAPPTTRHGRKRELRERNSECVRNLVRLTKRRHADVNLELNRRAGIRRVTEATLQQLERRLQHAEQWLRKV